MPNDDVGRDHSQSVDVHGPRLRVQPQPGLRSLLHRQQHALLQVLAAPDRLAQVVGVVQVGHRIAHGPCSVRLQPGEANQNRHRSIGVHIVDMHQVAVAEMVRPSHYVVAQHGIARLFNRGDERGVLRALEQEISDLALGGPDPSGRRAVDGVVLRSPLARRPDPEPVMGD